MYARSKPRQCTRAQRERHARVTSTRPEARGRRRNMVTRVMAGADSTCYESCFGAKFAPASGARVRLCTADAAHVVSHTHTRSVGAAHTISLLSARGALRESGVLEEYMTLAYERPPDSDNRSRRYRAESRTSALQLQNRPAHGGRTTHVLAST
jgi:hypothetical protein